jgi:hypothetical protein
MSKREMSAAEGFRDLRRRLPSLDRAFVRQRAIRRAVRILLTTGGVAIGFAIYELKTVQSGPAKLVSPQHALPGGVASTSKGSTPENAPDARSEVEAAGAPNGDR